MGRDMISSGGCTLILATRRFFKNGEVFRIKSNKDERKIVGSKIFTFEYNFTLTMYSLYLDILLYNFSFIP